jgi:hypothetical protein
MRLHLSRFAAAFYAGQLFLRRRQCPLSVRRRLQLSRRYKNSYGVLELSGKIEPSGEAIRFWTNYAE